MAPKHTVDLVIIGSGPVGLYATFYAGFRGLSVTVIDALPEVGGQISAMYPEKVIYDVAGFPGVKGIDLVNGLREQSERFDYELILNEAVVSLVPVNEDEYQLTTSAGTTLTTKAVILANGLGSFKPKALPAAKDGYEDKLLHFVSDLSVFDGKNVVIVGGGDSAVDWALAAQPRAKAVTIVHRRPRFRAHQASVDEMYSLGVNVIAPGEISEIFGAETITQVSVEHGAQPGVDAREETVDCDILVAALGFTSDLGPVKDWGIEFTGHHIAVDPTMRTSLPRVYAVGDVSEYAGKVRLIAVGFGEAAIAVNHVAADLNPEAQVFPGHSTSTTE